MASDNDLHQDFGELKGAFVALTGHVERLTDKVDELTAVLNQARGAKYALFVVPTLVSGVVTLLSIFGLKWAGH